VGEERKAPRIQPHEKKSVNKEFNKTGGGTNSSQELASTKEVGVHRKEHLNHKKLQNKTKQKKEIKGMAEKKLTNN